MAFTQYTFVEGPKLYTTPNPVTEFGPRLFMLLGLVALATGIVIAKHIVYGPG